MAGCPALTWSDPREGVRVRCPFTNLDLPAPCSFDSTAEPQKDSICLCYCIYIVQPSCLHCGNSNILLAHVQIIPNSIDIADTRLVIVCKSKNYILKLDTNLAAVVYADT